MGVLRHMIREGKGVEVITLCGQTFTLGNRRRWYVGDVLRCYGEGFAGERDCLRCARSFNAGER